MKAAIKVFKRDVEGRITWQYSGRILRRETNAVVLEAFFDHPDRPFMDVTFKKNDRFLETYYTDRWYNVFEIYDRDDGELKGWYCNVGQPAVIKDGTVSYVDLALDLWVSADGRQTVLDEEEFEALDLDDGDRQRALSALAELQQAFQAKRPPL